MNEENKRNTAKEKKKKNKGYPYRHLNLREVKNETINK